MKQEEVIAWKVLHLTLKKKWFDMIASGEKKEEYREGTEFWNTRLMNYDLISRNNVMPIRNYNSFKHFDMVHFVNGGNFHKSHPSVTVQCLGIETGFGKSEWGAEPGKEYFVIKLGEIISLSNPQTKTEEVL